jgi:ATP-dependent helicase HepA
MALSSTASAFEFVCSVVANIGMKEQFLGDLEGLIFHSVQFGYCKVVSHLNRQVQVRFCGNGREALYTLDTLLRGRDFKWKPLPNGLRCIVEGRGECTIVRSPFGPDETTQVHEYTVEFESHGRETANLSERYLWPIPGSLTETPQSRLASLQVDPWAHFRARDDLFGALARLHKETAGIRAMAASRIELLAHQASVVGTVIDDARWRYILADEVGLGKTIEAGVILHELVADRPQVRVLVLTPGALSRQWLCEMHLSFGGRDFKLADLHDARQVDWSRWTRVICSLKLATEIHGLSVLTQNWDLVIVDEAHHLLWNQLQYDFVKALSVQAGGILLLSAVPARERAKELLRLLQLIDPKTYADGTVVATRFEELYREQPLIGRRLRILQSRLSNSSGSVTDIQQAARRLLEIPILAGEPVLQAALQNVLKAGDAGEANQLCIGLMGEVASRYRISRRILKNRRSQLLDQELLKDVERRLKTVSYEPTRLESGAHDVLLLLMSRLLESGAPSDALHVMFRKAATSLCDPVALMEVAKSLQTAIESLESPLADLDPSAVLDYDEHERLLSGAGKALAPFIDSGLVDKLIEFATAWITKDSVPSRIACLMNALDQCQELGFQKILVFAGTMGAAELVFDQLRQRFGRAAVAEFRHDLDDDVKEAQVTRFRLELGCKILVCDESGGEGRNFQFASAVVHYDLPWSVAAVEQRIGRLDRIRRHEPVLSIVVAARNCIDAAWLQCLNEGFEVFGRSISGLEFLLRDTERRVIEHVMRYGPEGIGAMIEEVQDISSKERASDDSDALTDLASFDRSRRQPGSVEHTADARIEESFPRYLRTIGVGAVAKRTTDRRDLNLKIWCLRPEDVTHVQLPGIHRSAGGQLGDHYGTFLRGIARNRPDLEFFSTGHGLFESVCTVANSHVSGRTFAIQVTGAALPVGLHLLATVKVRPRSPGSGEMKIGRAARHLYGRRLRVMLNVATNELLDRAAVRGMESLLFGDDASITDLRDRAVSLIGGGVQDWPALVAKLVQAVIEQAPVENTETYAGEDQGFVDTVTRDITRLKQLGSGESIDQIESLAACCLAVEEPIIELDSLGIVQVVNASDVASVVS